MLPKRLQKQPQKISYNDLSREIIHYTEIIVDYNEEKKYTAVIRLSSLVIDLVYINHPLYVEPKEKEFALIQLRWALLYRRNAHERLGNHRQRQRDEQFLIKNKLIKEPPEKKEGTYKVKEYETIIKNLQDFCFQKQSILQASIWWTLNLVISSPVETIFPPSINRLLIHKN